jgi:hypothetical protein
LPRSLCDLISVFSLISAEIMTAKTTKDRAETYNGGEETHKGRRQRRRAETHKGRRRRNPQGAVTTKASRDPQQAAEKKPTSGGREETQASEILNTDILSHSLFGFLRN